MTRIKNNQHETLYKFYFWTVSTVDETTTFVKRYSSLFHLLLEKDIGKYLYIVRQKERPPQTVNQAPCLEQQLPPVITKDSKDLKLQK